jgi:hypothetical protein
MITVDYKSLNGSAWIQVAAMKTHGLEVTRRRNTPSGKEELPDCQWVLHWVVPLGHLHLILARPSATIWICISRPRVLGATGPGAGLADREMAEAFGLLVQASRRPGCSSSRSPVVGPAQVEPGPLVQVEPGLQLQPLNNPEGGGDPLG